MEEQPDHRPSARAEKRAARRALRALPRHHPDKRARRWRRATLLGVMAVLFAGVVLGGVALLGRPLTAPGWVQARIEARIAAAVPGLQVGFGRMSVEISYQGQPRVILWDVDLRNSRGEQIAALSDIEAGFDPLALLRGQVELQSANVSGAFVTFQRDQQGRVGLALGDVFSAGTSTPDLSQLIAQIDMALADPRLSALKTFEADALTIRFEDLRAHRGWTADGGRLRVSRNDGRLSLTGDVVLLAGGDDVATLALTADSPIGQNSLDFGFNLQGLSSRDIATQSPALAWLGLVQAPISGALRSSLRADGSLGPLSATLQVGQGQLQPSRDVRAIPFDSARIYMNYQPDLAELRFDEISLSAPLLAATAEGVTRIEGLDQGWPTALSGQFALSRIRLAEGAIFDHEVAVSGANAAFRLQLDPFRLTLGSLRSMDPTYPASASAALTIGQAGWDVALQAQAPRTTPAQVLSFWPADLAPKGRAWVARNVQDGQITDVSYALRWQAGDTPYHHVDLQFHEAQVRIGDFMPPITGGDGRLVIAGRRLGLRLDQGTVTPPDGGGIEVGGSQFVIPDLKAKPAQGDLRLRARSSLTAALSYIDNPRWKVLSKIGRSADLATGFADVTARLQLPLTKNLTLDQMDLDLTGDLTGVASDTLVPGRPLRAVRLQLALDQTQVQVSGPLTLSGIPATGRWQQSFVKGAAGEVTADVQVDPQTLAALGVDLPPGLVRGRGRGSLRLELPKPGPARFSFSSDLNGLALSIPELGWQLGTGQTGQFDISGTLETPLRVDSLQLRGAGLEAKGGLRLAPQGGLDRLELSQLKIGDWLDVTGTLRGRGAGRAPALEVSGGQVDLRRAPFGSGQTALGGPGGVSAAGGSGGSAPLALTLQRLQVTDTIWIDGFRGNFDLTGGLRGLFDGRLGGKAKLAGEVLPQNGGTAVRVRGEDAGDVLKASGLLKTVQNGTFQMDLAPVRGQPGSYDGALQIRDARLRNAPAIGALLDAVSIVGLLDQLNGPGIYFAEVSARFRMTPSRIVLSEASAVGPSMGISMDGYYDLARREMDMQGVLSPIYFLNGIGRLIARKGEGLIGFNFNLKGAVDQPRVLVNPLSVFTPGMFRDIFRRPPPKLPE
ncbi:MAG: DUF3971 domain-containing protein [Pelagimonas sp.]|nr:DUF3971 domain-containing protein [Pelagimonas sp.]